MASRPRQPVGAALLTADRHRNIRSTQTLTYLAWRSPGIQPLRVRPSRATTPGMAVSRRNHRHHPGMARRSCHARHPHAI